ncbi:MAG: hypothetical protein DMF63_03075 [Acidobacteria bacterium]|nr:MAG: hypothetical protein DMF63_03075 [Acidobacteriota bacterium]
MFSLFTKQKYSAARLTMLLALVLMLSSFGSAQSIWGTAAGQKSRAGQDSDQVVMAPLAVTLQQCANGGRGTPEVACAGNAPWQNGNLGRNNSQWVEGEFVPYRALITGLTPGSTGNTVTINYATTNTGKHAIDYLGTFDASVQPPQGPGGADPCINVSPCVEGASFPVPDDPNSTVTQIPGSFRIWNGDITGVSAYTLTGTYAGTSETSITLTFTATDDNVVIAYGGHISTRIDWTIAGSAISISGSPYHSNLNGGANRSMSVDAAIFPAFLRITKEVSTQGPPVGSTSTFAFNFTFTQGTTVTPFSLIDDVVGPGPGSPISTNATETFQITAFDAANTINIVENNYLPVWTLAALTCTEDPGGLPQTDDAVLTLATRTATLIPQEAEIIQCTYANSQLAPTAAPASISGRVVDSFGQGIGGARLTVTNPQTGDAHVALTNPFGYYTVTETEVGNFYVMTVSHKRYTFADDTRTFSLNDDIAGVDFVANP